MQFQVPQFIDIEDKVIGPFTFRQFLFLLGGVGGGFIIYKACSVYLGLPTVISYTLATPPIAIGLALAFYKVNNRPLIDIIEAAFKYYIGEKQYLWKKEEQVKQAGGIETTQEKPTGAIAPKLTSGRLRDIAWSLDIQEKIKK